MSVNKPIPHSGIANMDLHRKPYSRHMAAFCDRLWISNAYPVPTPTLLRADGVERPSCGNLKKKLGELLQDQMFGCIGNGR